MIKLKHLIYSLRTQLIIYYIVISMVILAIGSYFSYKYFMEIFMRQNERYLLQQFSQADYNINGVVSEIDKLSKLFLLDDNVQQLLAANYNKQEFDTVETYKNVISRINDFMSNYSYINSIYLFTENGGELGASINYTNIVSDDKKNEAFFSSKLYKNAMKSFPLISLDGGKKDKDYNVNIKNKGTFIISVARGVKPIFKPNKSATLVFNINENYISSIYCGKTNLDKGYLYIVDDDGTIVSSSDGNKVGNRSQIISNINLKKNYGSFTSLDKNEPKQIVYYKLKNANWYLIDELPLELSTEDSISLQKIIIIVFCLSILAIFIVSFFWLKKITKPLRILEDKMSDMSNGKLGVTLSKIPKNELGTLVKKFNEMSLSIVELLRKNEEIQDEKRKLEIETLQNQINPHFIYNTLNMIKWMGAIINAKNIVESIIALGNILRPVFKENNQMCTIKDEVEYLENYLKIMNWRYGNSANFEIDVARHLMDFKIPRFILQPIIENSFTHGISRDKNLININIKAHEQDDNLLLVVSDTGIGINEGRVQEINKMLDNEIRVENTERTKGIGLYNVNKRIRLNFGKEFGIRLVSSEGMYTKVLIDVPKIQ